jgi:hypothetical protein
MADPLLPTVVADQRRLMAEAATPADLVAEAVEGTHHPAAVAGATVVAEVEATVAVDVAKSKQLVSKKPPDRAAFYWSRKSILVGTLK